MPDAEVSPRPSPLIRASYTKLALRHIKLAHPTSWSDVGDSIGNVHLQRIREASPLTLLPADLHGRVANSMVQVMGTAGARAAWRDVMLDSFERALLRPLVASALVLYGKKPSSIMRMTPQGWSLVFKDCGRSWMEEKGERHVAMRFESLPPVVTDSPGFIDSFAANCDAALSYTHTVGTVTVNRQELSEGKLEIDVTWNARAV